MTLRLTKQIFSTFAVLAFITSAGSAFAQDPGGPFIVASQVISDTATPASAYVGDMASATVESSDAGGSCANGTCANGNCGGGSCGDICSSGNCGGCGKCGGGRLGKLFDGSKCGPDNQPGYLPRKYDRSDLFYNFYSKGNYNTANAQMYISPVPVPAFVGHTFNTYQPFYPHEFMYWHKNKFHNNYDNGRGMNRTKALYYAPPIKTAIKNLYWNKLRLPR